MGVSARSRASQKRSETACKRSSADAHGVAHLQARRRPARLSPHQLRHGFANRFLRESGRDFVALQAKFKDSENSWTVDAKSIDKITYDLSVKNPNKADETELRDPKDIIAEMAALDVESAAILKNIEAML